jgi:hypothetical protein
MRRIRRSMRQHDVYEWVDSFLRAGIAKDLSAFPLPEDFVPRERGTTEAMHGAEVSPTVVAKALRRSGDAAEERRTKRLTTGRANKGKRTAR